MRILICDDDDFILQQLTNYLNEYFRKAGADCPEIVCYREGESLLADRGEKDIVFLDIELGGPDGIYVGAELKKQDKNITHTSHTKNRHIIGSYATLGI